LYFDAKKPLAADSSDFHSKDRFPLFGNYVFAFFINFADFKTRQANFCFESGTPN